MTRSADKMKRVQLYRERAMSARADRPYKLNETQFKSLLQIFYVEAEKHGFYTRLGDALERGAFFFTEHQRSIAEAMLLHVFTKTPATINVSITRQFGKTELVTMVVAFCYDHFYKAFGEPFKCCIIAPEKGTASEVFNRVTSYILANDTELLVDKNNEKETLRGDVVRLFGIYKDSRGGTIEGRTHNLVIRDEAHLGDDEKFSDQVEPTTIRTDGSIVFIGNAGFGSCTFRENIKRGTCDILDADGKKVGKNIVFRYTYKTLMPYMKNLSDKGLHSAGAWIRGVEKYVSDRGGMESYFVMKNIFCEWIVSFGNFVTQEHLNNCKRKSPRLPSISRDLYLGIDFAFSGDRTIATLLNKDRQIEDWVILKDANEQKTLKAQCQELYNYCEEKSIMDRLAAIGGDSTGMGLGAVEFLEQEFSCEIMNYTFSQRKKHEWYIGLRDLVTTTNESDRLYYDPSHKHAMLFEREMKELEVTVSKNGYLTFQAPKKQGHYDDMVASLAISVDMMAREINMYSGNNRKPKNTTKANITAKRLAKKLRDKFLGIRVNNSNDGFFSRYSHTI